MENMNENNIVIEKFNGFDLSKYVNSTESNIDGIAEYTKKMARKEIFKMSFTCADEFGNLYDYHNGVRVQMDNKQITGFSYNPKHKAQHLGVNYTVTVVDVNEETKTVKVSSFAALKGPREQLEKALKVGIENERYLRVPAVVVGTNKYKDKNNSFTVALINIGGLGIPGAIRLAEWSTAYTKTFWHTIQAGMNIEVVVTGQQNWKTGDVFDCSRRLALDFNPWENIEERLPAKTSVIVKCTSKEARNFFGIIDNLPEINVYCEYPDPGSNIRIVEGAEYVGYVYRVREESKLLKVRILRQKE